MKYRSVGNRCAVNLASLGLPISDNEALKVLEGKGFMRLEVDVVELACRRIGRSQYRRSARPSEAPEVVDCSSLMKWLYSQKGIWLPRRTIQQRELGQRIALEEVMAGDLIFTSGHIDYYYDDLADGVGHVGLVTYGRTVIHAANSRVGVIEEELETFLKTREFRGARRYIPKGVEVFTFETPDEREVEIADDLRWIILQSLSR